MNYDALFVSPRGRVSRGQFVPAVLTLLAVMLFFGFIVKGRTAQFCMLVLLYPAFMLHAKRLHDRGRSAWLLLLPLMLLKLAFAIRLRYLTLGTDADAALPAIAFAVGGAFALWGCLARGQDAANRFGAPLPA